MASIILYRREKFLSIAEIVEDADFLFKYFKTKRSRKTTMNVVPPQALIEAHIDWLGFPMEGRGTKGCVVVLEPKVSKLET